MKANLLISNARIVTAFSTFPGNIYVTNGGISAITSEKKEGMAREIAALRARLDDQPEDVAARTRAALLSSCHSES